MTNATHPFDALMDITARPPAVFVRGEGSWLWDDSGKRYLDFVQGWAVNCLGHSPPVRRRRAGRAGKAAADAEPGLLQRAEPQARARRWSTTAASIRCSLPIPAPKPMKARSSSRANTARCTSNGAHEIITFEGGFHGRTLATMSASGKKAFEPLFEPKVPGFRKAQLNDLELGRSA